MARVGMAVDMPGLGSEETNGLTEKILMIDSLPKMPEIGSAAENKTMEKRRI